MLILIQLGLSSLLNTHRTFYNNNGRKHDKVCLLMLHNKGTDLYNNNGRDYKAILYDGLHIQSNTPPASQ